MFRLCLRTARAIKSGHPTTRRSTNSTLSACFLFSEQKTLSWDSTSEKFTCDVYLSNKKFLQSHSFSSKGLSLALSRVPPGVRHRGPWRQAQGFTWRENTCFCVRCAKSTLLATLSATQGVRITSSCPIPRARDLGCIGRLLMPWA